MNEIMFRAWHFGRKEFIYAEMVNIGSLIYAPDMPDPRMFSIVDLPVYSDPQRFTGLRDKNQVRIYEGDIVKNEFFVDMIVSFGERTISDNEMYSDNDVVGFYLEVRDGNYMHLDHKKYPLEIIGNIYETPNLLKEKN